MSTGSSKEFKTGGISAHMVLIICSLLYMVNYMDRQVLSAVLEPMRIDLGLTDAQAGVIQTVFLLSIALFSFPVAFLVDRWSRKKSIGLMAIVWSAFTFLTGKGVSFLTVIIPRAIVGVGEAGFSAGGTAMISAAYPKESRGKVMGVFNLVIPLGAALGVILGGMIAESSGSWRTPFYVFAIPGIVLGIAAFFLKDYKTVVDVDETGKKRGFLKAGKDLFRIPTLRWIFIGYGIHNIMAFSVLTWFSAYFMRSQGITVDKAGTLLGIISLMAVIGAPLGGFLADTWQKKNDKARMLLPAVADVVSALVLIAALVFKVQGIGFYLALVWGVVFMMGLPALSAVTQDVVPPGLKGMAWGMTVLTMYIFGGGWAPYAVGAVSDGLFAFLGGTAEGITEAEAIVFKAEGLRYALMIAATSGIIGSIFFFLGAKRYPEDMEKVKDITLEAE
jgi:MFS family permease